MKTSRGEHLKDSIRMGAIVHVSVALKRRYMHLLCSLMNTYKYIYMPRTICDKQLAGWSCDLIGDHGV